MAQKTTRGIQTEVEQPIQLEATHRNGGSTVRTWVYPNPSNDLAPALALARYNNMYVGGWDVKMSGGSQWTVTATLGYDINAAGSSMPESTWEIGGTPVDQNLFESSINIVTGLSTTTKTLIEARLKAPATVAPLTTVAEVSQLTNATKVYNLMRAGADSKRIFLPSVKRSVTLNTGFSGLTWTLGNVGNVVSRSNLISLFGVPNLIQPLLDNSAFTTDTAGIQTYTGYLVFYPTVSYTGNNKVQVAQEFLYGKWSTDIYTIVS